MQCGIYKRSTTLPQRCADRAPPARPLLFLLRGRDVSKLRSPNACVFSWSRAPPSLICLRASCTHVLAVFSSVCRFDMVFASNPPSCCGTRAHRCSLSCVLSDVCWGGGAPELFFRQAWEEDSGRGQLQRRGRTGNKTHHNFEFYLLFA